MDIELLLANAVAVGIGQATVWLLITYFVIRMRYKLKPLNEAWRLFFGCVLALALLNFIYKATGLSSGSPNLMSLIVTLVIPPFFVATILYIFHRET